MAGSSADKSRSLARAILDALENPAEARRRAIEGQKLAEKLFDVERAGREVAGIYEKILVPQSRSDVFNTLESQGRVIPEAAENEIARGAAAQ